MSRSTRYLTAAVKVLMVVLLVMTPVTLAISIVGDLQYARQGSSGLIVQSLPTPLRGLDVVEVIPESPAHARGLQRGDRILAVNNRPVENPEQINFRAPGSRVVLTVDRHGTVWQVSMPYPNLFEHTHLGLVPWLASQLTALIFYFIGLVVAVKSRRRVGTLLTFTCCFLTLAFNGSLVIRLPALADFPLIQSFLILGREAPVFIGLAISLTVHFAAVFPRPQRFLLDRPVLAILFYVPVPFMIGVYALFLGRWSFDTLLLVETAILSAGVLTALALLHRSSRTAPEERERLQAQVLFWGMLLGIIPQISYLVLNRFFNLGVSWPVFVNLTVLLFPLSFAYVVLKNRFLGVQLLLTGGAKFALVSRVADLAFVLFAAALAGRPLYLIGRDGPKTSTMVFLTVGLGVIVALSSVRRRVGELIEERFFPRVHDARRTLRELGQVAVTVLDLQQLLDLVVNKVTAAFRLENAAVLVREHERFEVRSATGYPFALETLVGFAADGAMARLLEVHPHGARVFLDDQQCAVCAALAGQQTELEALRRLDAALLMPLRSRQGLVGFLALGNKPSRETFTEGEMELLREAATQVGVAVENAHLTREIAGREQQRREIERARRLQASLLPDQDPSWAGLELAGRCRPAAEVAGDYYDYLELEDGRIAVILGDVTGHGLDAGMMVAVAKAALRTQVSARPALPDMLAAMDRAMRMSTGATLFMTAVLVILDPRTRRMEYGIAGHPPPLLLRSNGSLERLNSGYYPLGIESDRPYEPQCLDLDDGEALLLYSDGILEARNTDGEPFGLERLSAAFVAASGANAVHVRNRVLAALSAFTGDRTPEDDVTIVVLKVGPGQG